MPLEQGTALMKSLFSKITDINPNDRFPLGTTIAALDLGSNSFHLIVVKAHTDKSFEVLLKEKSMIRLGDVVSRLGYIDEKHVSIVIDAVRSYRTLSESLGASEMVALATSAFRDAENSSEVVDAIEDDTGVSVSVISGHKEAELIFKAVSTSVTFPSDVAMCVDLGGGSLEVMIGSQSELYWSHSFNLGVSRLTAMFVSDPDSVSSKEISRMHSHVRETLSPVRAKVDMYRPVSLIGSSGSFLTLGRMALMHQDVDKDLIKGDDMNQVSVRRSLLRSVGSLILKSDGPSRLDLPGIDPKRSDIITAAAVVLEELLEPFGFEEMTFSEWALREGIILSELENYQLMGEAGDSVRMSSVLGVTHRFHWNGRHAQHVSDLALSMFDQTQEIHHLGENERELLHYGALLHDIGEHIAMEDHDIHSAYLIEHSRLRGFSPQEKRVLISLGRFHRRGSPKADFAPFAQLDPQWQSTVIKLVAILRIADALDRSHEEVVTEVVVSLEKERVVLGIRAIDDFELESFGLRRKRSLFEQTFGLKLAVEPV